LSSHAGSAEDVALYRVVVNDEHEYSVWPLAEAAPAGWRPMRFSGSEQACLDHIGAVWGDMRPASLRRALLAGGGDPLATLARTSALDGGGEAERRLADAAVLETSIVIALKDDERIFRCIESVDEDVEIVLSLNGTPDGLRKRLEQAPGRIVITSIPETGNLGGAYNAGIEAASGRYILLMDSDCVFDPGVIRRMAYRAAVYPVVKGQVVYGVAPGLVSALIARIREFDEGDYISALSPPLIYDRTIARYIGGYQFEPLIHWCEDREFDFRLQLADIPVLYDGQSTIHHDAQKGFQDFRSYWRYGVGEGIGQELGVFSTPAIPVVWRLASDLGILFDCARSKGPLAALYYLATLVVFHCGTLWHGLADPYRVKGRLPDNASRLRLVGSIPQHCTALTETQKTALRRHHAAAGRMIDRQPGFRRLFEEARAHAFQDQPPRVIPSPAETPDARPVPVEQGRA